MAHSKAVAQHARTAQPIHPSPTVHAIPVRCTMPKLSPHVALASLHADAQLDTLEGPIPGPAPDEISPSDCGHTCTAGEAQHQLHHLRMLTAITLPPTLSVPNGPSVVFPSTSWNVWCTADPACNALVDVGNISLTLTQPNATEAISATSKLRLKALVCMHQLCIHSCKPHKQFCPKAIASLYHSVDHPQLISVCMWEGSASKRLQHPPPSMNASLA